MTNEFIALVKNTTLVLVVSIFDLLGIAQSAVSDPAWVGLSMETYAFSGVIYWLNLFRALALQQVTGKFRHRRARALTDRSNRPARARAG